MDIDKVKDYLISAFIMMILPILTFFIIFFFVYPLDVTIFIIVLTASFYSFCINAARLIKENETGWKAYVKQYLILILGPIIGVYLISLQTPDVLKSSNFYGLILGVFTGFCWGKGFELIARHEYKKIS